MSNTTTQLFVFSRSRRLRARRGQSVVVALLVLLLLGFVGALFITIVARNVFNARHAARVVNADYYAKAGITFADAQLTYGPDGADWRPPLQNKLANPPLPAYALREAKRYDASVAANGLAAAAATDPDKAYLDAGYTRYTAGAGRFLLRLTYDPVNLNGATAANPNGTTSAPGRYIKIEAIGREGVIDPLDPTTYGNNRSSDRTQAYQVAYKPIGITDYARFETNLENRSDIANIGVVSQQYIPDPDGHIATPGAFDFNGSGNKYQLYPVVTTYGAADAFLKSGSGLLYPNPTAGTNRSAPSGYTLAVGGGSNRANMPVRFFGKNVFYLNDASATAPLFQDTAEIAGNLLLDNYQPADHLDNSGVPAVGQRAVLSLNPTDPLNPINTGILVSPSNAGQVTGDVNPPFDTHGGLIRDGSSQNDANGQPRAIKRLDPPLMDSVDPGSSLPRYKQISLTSPPRLDISTGTYGTPSTYTSYQDNSPAKTAAANGYGRTIYINNPNDIQQESASIGNGTTLTDEWLNTTKAAGVPSFGGWNGDLYSPVGVNITLGLQTAAFPASGGTFTTRTFPGIRLTRSDNVSWKDSKAVALPGVASDGTTASTMYIAYDSLNANNDPKSVFSSDNLDNDVILYAEGNVRIHGIVSPDSIPRHITIVTNGTAYIDGNVLKGNPDSSVTILAHDYVCVNTTQFLAGPQLDQNPALTPSKTTGFYTFDTTLNTLVQEFHFGFADITATPVTSYPGPIAGSAKLALYVSGQADSGSDPPSAQALFNITDVTGTINLFSQSQNFTSTAHRVFDLSGVTALTNSTPLDMRHLTVHVDPNPNANPTPAPADFLMERAAILPMDIRIEAVLYAQTRSFFVIPGPSFNSDPDDTINLFTYGNNTPTRVPGLRSGTSPDARFPLYGQPIDMKIVIDGAVTESRPADINAQTAWMLRWGWIPQFHGSLLTESAGHPNRVGLQMIYNPQAGYPFVPNGTAANAYYLRSDQYGRPLPFAPRLPVSTGLLFSGESGEAPILQ